MKNFTIGLGLIFLLNSCASIFGGAKYQAIINVNNCTDCIVKLNNIEITNSSTQLIKRKDANKVKITVEKEGFETEEFIFNHRVFRGWALVSSILFTPRLNVFSSTSSTSNGTSYFTIGLPIGLVIDLFNISSLWKPDVNDSRIVKHNYDKYGYELTFKGRKIKSEKPTSQEDELLKLKEMKDKGLIDEIAYKKMKSKILNIEENESIDEQNVIENE